MGSLSRACMALAVACLGIALVLARDRSLGANSVLLAQTNCGCAPATSRFLDQSIQPPTAAIAFCETGDAGKATLRTLDIPPSTFRVNPSNE